MKPAKEQALKEFRDANENEQRAANAHAVCKSHTNLNAWHRALERRANARAILRAIK
jgi:hypothetical protein